MIAHTVCYTIIITVAVVELMQCISYEIINYFVQVQIIDLCQYIITQGNPLSH